MDFTLSREDTMIKDAIRDWVAKECTRDTVAELDEKDAYPTKLAKKLSQLGFCGMTITEEDGGEGRNMLGSCIVAETIATMYPALARWYTGLAFYGGAVISTHGSGSQKDRYLAKCASGKLMVAIAQTETDWNLLARDDGSFDQTPDILARAAGIDNRISILRSAKKRTGPAGNFAELLEAAAQHPAEFFALCDQDDVWQPDKLKKQLAALRTLESGVGRECPLMVHSDLEVTDSNMQTRHSSLMRFQLIEKPATANHLMLVAQNHVERGRDGAVHLAAAIEASVSSPEGRPVVEVI